MSSFNEECCNNLKKKKVATVPTFKAEIFLKPLVFRVKAKHSQNAPSVTLCVYSVSVTDLRHFPQCRSGECVGSAGSREITGKLSYHQLMGWFSWIPLFPFKYPPSMNDCAKAVTRQEKEG